MSLKFSRIPDCDSYIVFWKGAFSFPPNAVSCRPMSIAPTLWPMAVTLIQFSQVLKIGKVVGFCLSPLCGSPPKYTMLSRTPILCQSAHASVKRT